MQSFYIFIFIACALGTCYGLPAETKKDTGAEPKSDGVGAFAYQDSTGRRYGGTYGLRNGEIIPNADEPVPSFVTNNFGYNNHGGVNDFFPEYFRTFQNILSEDSQQDLTNPYIPDQPDISSYTDGRFPSFPMFKPFKPFNFDFNNVMPNFGANNAFASGYIGPDGTQQAAMINPENPLIPNIDFKSRIADGPSEGGFNAVHSSSYSMSSDVNGQKVSNRGAHTVINNNGKITEYSVHD